MSTEDKTPAPALFGFHPIEIPREPGMCAIRVKVPVTPVEKAMQRDLPEIPIWRVWVWFQGRLWFTSTQSGEPPELYDALSHLQCFPERWPEILNHGSHG